jgi:hypothetical protein
MSAAVSRSCAVATLVVFALWLAGTARAQGSDWPAPLPAQATAQQATTGQTGIANADAADAQPTNIFVSLRVDSPGDNGPVTQTSTTAVAAETANDAATAQDAWQDWDSGDRAAQPAPQASAQDSGTTQAAATSATATQPKPTNVVVSVRVNSPGDDAPVSQTSTVAVGAESKNAAATAQKAEQGQAGGGSAVPTAAPESAAPPPGAVAERPAAASSPTPTHASPPSANCVRVAPGAPTRIVITIGQACHHAARKRVATAPKRHETPVQAAPPAPSAPVPVVHAAPAVSPAPPASAPRRVAAEPRPAPAAPRPRAAEPKSLDPLAASTKVADLVAAASLPQEGEAQYGLMLALLLAVLGTAALWSYGGIHRYRFWRWR